MTGERTVRTMPRRVLIIGATSEIAAHVASLQADAGHRLYLVARNEARLGALVEELGEAVVGFEVADLDQLEANAARVARAVETLGEIDEVLIAHGYLGDQLRSEAELSEALAIVHTNFTSVVSLLIPLANHFETRGRGHIAVITSVAGERGRPRNFTYGAAKGGLTRYLEGLRSRLGPLGVRVHNLKLGPVDTPMTVDHEKTALFAEAPAVAQRIVTAMQGRRHVVYIPWFWRWIMALVRWMPEWIFQKFTFLSGR